MSLLLIFGVVFLVIGVILLITAIVLLADNKPKEWYMWLLLIVGISLTIGGLVMMALYYLTKQPPVVYYDGKDDTVPQPKEVKIFTY